MITKLFDLDKRIVVVTGGLGQLGQEFSKALQLYNARVVVLDINIDKAVSPNIESDNLLTISCDVTSKKEIELSLSIITEHWGVPYGLINNAALDSSPNSSNQENGPFEDFLESSWDKVMEVNSKGPFLLSQVFGGAMARLGRGSIVNVSSIYGVVSPNQNIYKHSRGVSEEFYKPVAYSASKASLLNLTKYLATYWSKKSVRVNTLVLGGVFNNQDERFLLKYNENVPMGRMAASDEYNGSVIFLMSDASSYMTGSEMVIDGGWTAW